MLKPVRIEAGLGDPPSEYVNNDPEAANFMIKHGLHFDAKKPHQFIEEIKNIVEAQHRNEDRAVFGKGPYKVRKEFEHLVVDDTTWGRLTQEQRMRRLTTFLKTSMGGKKDFITEEPANLLPTPSSFALDVAAEDSGITTIPIAILEAMFDKAAKLVSTLGSVVPKPGASDDSFMVAGVSNKVHCVTPGKGDSLTCDRTCINHSTKICEHTLAVAQVKGKLSEFIAWYKRSKRSPNMTNMATDGGPKSAGRKPSRRKRSNTKTQPVHEYIDLLQDRSSMDVPSHGQNDALPVSYQCSSVPVPAHVTVPSVSPPSNGLLTGGHYSINHFASSYPLAHQNSAFPFTSDSISVQQVGMPFPNYQHAILSPGVNSFVLKWLPGTRVSRCYGCGGEIQNPPLNFPDDLIVMYRDIRQYRDRNTGQIHSTSEPQNVHFHLRLACVRARYPNFVTSSLHVPPDFVQRFRLEHLERLMLEFAWTPGN